MDLMGNTAGYAKSSDRPYVCTAVLKRNLSYLHVFPLFVIEFGKLSLPDFNKKYFGGQKNPEIALSRELFSFIIR